MEREFQKLARLLAVELDIVKKAGSWFSYDGNRLGQGRDAVKALIKDNPELMDELEAKVRAKVNNEPDSLIDTSEPNVKDDGSPE
jgi:recombination protein RecA